MYDCIIVGGGMAGLQAAIQLGRYRRNVLLIDRGDGRSSLCRSYHNVLGYPDGVSGQALRDIGRRQAESYGVEFVEGNVTEARQTPDGFTLACVSREQTIDFQGKTVLLATGVMDRMPELPGLRPCLGVTVYVCPDCDGYETRGRRTVVLGAGNAGAEMAAALTYFCQDVLYINHERREMDDEMAGKLKGLGIPVFHEAVASIGLAGAEEEGRIQNFILENGAVVAAERAFLAFGGNEVRSELAKQLGAERLENRHILTDPRSKMTRVPGVWAAGDVAVHAEQLTIAIGEGQQAAIWMHKWLLAAAR